MPIYLCPGLTLRYFVGIQGISILYISKITPDTAIAEHYQGPTPDQLN